MYIRLDYEISLLRLLEKVSNGTVIEISVTGGLPWSHFMSKDCLIYFCWSRYCYPSQTWNYFWRYLATRLPHFASYWILPWTCHYAGPICEETNEYHAQRYHHRWARPFGMFLQHMLRVPFLFACLEGRYITHCDFTPSSTVWHFRRIGVAGMQILCIISPARWPGTKLR